MATRDPGDDSDAGRGSRSEPELVLPTDFDDYGWEVEAKGYFATAHVRWAGREVLVTFYDPARLMQDIEAELDTSPQVALERVVVVRRVTAETMRTAAHALPPTFFT